MKYKYLNKQKILKVSPFMEKMAKNFLFANEKDNPISQLKDLVVEEKPAYNEETQELYSWFEDGEVITQKFKVVEKTA